MSIPSFRSTEPLYIIAVHKEPQAEAILKNWQRKNSVEHVSIQGHRMMIHERRAFEKFVLTWNHPTLVVTVWDTWLRKHIYLD